jgi:hypothetical protein
MDMTLAEMDVFGKRRSFKKKRNKKILIFNTQILEDMLLMKKEE